VIRAAQHGAAQAEVIFEGALQAFHHRHVARFGSLALADADDAIGKVNIGGVQ